MDQDKEYIPEWKQPHIGSEARKFITFAEVRTYRIIQDQSWVSETLNMTEKK